MAERYLYNGVELPALPEWDRKTYPYAKISIYASIKYELTISTTTLYRKNQPQLGNYYTYPDSIPCSIMSANISKTDAENESWEFTWSETYEEELTGAGLSVPLWSNFDVLNEDDTVYLEASDPVHIYGWETLCEGEKQNDISGDYGKLLWLWDNQSTTGVNILSAGDVVRVTVDGTVYVYTVQATQYESAVEAGNKWLGLVSGGSTITDDGTDFYFFEMYGGLRAYTRTFGMHSVKFERAITNKPALNLDHTALAQGWWVGKRLAAMRVKREPVAYLYNGVRLPPLPEWDKAKYPNALLTRFWDKWWILHIFGEYTVLDSPPNNPTDQDSDWIVLNGTGDTSNCEAYLKSAYDEETGQWGAFESDQYSPYTDYLSNVKWSSVDLHAYDGSLYLAASTPVPVYE